MLSLFNRRRLGFSLVEIVIAVVMLGVIGGGLVATMGRNNDRTVEAQERQTALTLAKTQVERIRAAGPLTYRTPGETFQATAEGKRLSTGVYRVTITRKIVCQGGAITEDTPKSLLEWNCTTQKPVVTYQVDVVYPSKTKKRAQSQNAATATNMVGMSVSFGESDLVGQSCSGGQSWNPSTNACACPGGQSWDATLNSGRGACTCPAFQAWNGMACVATTCPGPFAQFENRADCQSNQIGSSDWRSDRSGTYCRTSPNGAYEAYYEIDRNCACPVNIPDWNGTLCVCNNASAPLTQAPACVGVNRQVEATPDTRTFTAATCSVSAWNPGTCTCPSPMVYVSPGVCGCANAPAAATDTVKAPVCPGLQVPTSNQTRIFTDYNGTASSCTYTAWTAGTCGCPNAGQPLTQDYSFANGASCPGAQQPSGTQTRTFDSGPACAYSAWSGGVCSCPNAGQALSEPYPGPCPGGQTAYGTRTRTFDNTACTYSGWSGGTCSCANAGQALSRASQGPCPGNQTPGGTQDRTFDGTACTYSGWTGGTCACPAPGALSQPTPDAACPASQYGTGNQTRTYDATWCSYSGWSGGSCTDRCSAPFVWGGSGCVCPNAGQALSETQAFGGPCASGQYATGSESRARTWDGGNCTYSVWSAWSGGTCLNSCAAGTTWNGSACVCDNAGQATSRAYAGACGGGQVAMGTETRTFSGANACSYSAWSGGYCACPAGTNMRNGSCQACPWGESRTLNCPAGFNGTYDQSQANYCDYSASGWGLVADRCCPAPQVWNGSGCSCSNAGQPLSQATPASACGGGSLPSGTQTRTFDAGTCSYSGWSGGSCYCPGATVWNGASCVCPNTGEATYESAGCPAGWSGTQSRSRSFSGPDACVYSAWSAWAGCTENICSPIADEVTENYYGNDYNSTWGNGGEYGDDMRRSVGTKGQTTCGYTSVCYIEEWSSHSRTIPGSPDPLNEHYDAYLKTNCSGVRLACTCTGYSYQYGIDYGPGCSC